MAGVWVHMACLTVRRLGAHARLTVRRTRAGSGAHSAHGSVGPVLAIKCTHAGSGPASASTNRRSPVTVCDPAASGKGGHTLSPSSAARSVWFLGVSDHSIDPRSVARRSYSLSKYYPPFPSHFYSRLPRTSDLSDSRSHLPVCV